MANFGEKVKGYNIPVLNEREIRASSGILFVIALISLMLILFKGNFVLAKYFVILFLTDFIIRVFINPKYAPTLIVGRFIVSNQSPEYVGAPQKKFAWKIGIILASIMFLFLIILNTYSPITGIICLICLIFLFFESAFGICLGCLLYGWYYKEKAQYCPGEICDILDKKEIQKINKKQIIILISFTIYLVICILVLNNIFHNQPYHLLDLITKFKS